MSTTTTDLIEAQRTGQTPEPPKVEQPSDIVREADYEGKAVEVLTPRGALAIEPGQEKLTSAQIEGFVAIGIDVKRDPGIITQIPAFLHICSVRGLDPIVREAYLIGRGDGDFRKWTMQVGIDGYMKMVKRSGSFRRVAETLWTGPEDIDRYWREDARGIMRRVWFDQWPASRHYPGSAKTIIEHYADDGTLTETEGIADWTMYAPLFPAWHWGQRRGEKVFETNEDGSPKMELNDMWTKGYAHMLAKCSRALTTRLIVPAWTSGVYIPEEMHRLDAAERERVLSEKQNRRVIAYNASKATVKPEDPDAPAGDDTSSEPILVGDVVDEVLPKRPPESEHSDEDQKRLLRREVEFQAEVLGSTPAALSNRRVRATKRNFEDFTVQDLFWVVVAHRQQAAARLQQTNRADEAAAYLAVPAESVVDVDVLGAVEGEVVGGDGETVTDETVDSTQPHTYADNGGLCLHCQEEQEHVLHVE